MPKTYTPVTNPLPEARIKKICADLIKDAKKERDLVMDAHKFFSDILKDDPADNMARVQLGVILKLMQTSHSKIADALRCLYKYEEIQIKSRNNKPVSGDTPEEDELFGMLAKMNDNEQEPK